MAWALKGVEITTGEMGCRSWPMLSEVLGILLARKGVSRFIWEQAGAARRMRMARRTVILRILFPIMIKKYGRFGFNHFGPQGESDDGDAAIA